MIRQRAAPEPFVDPMSRPSARVLGEVIAVLSVVLSLVFVGLQLRQSAIAARASAYQELSIAMSEGFRLRASDRELNDLIVRAGSSDPAEWATLTDSDINLARVYVLSVLRLYQSAFLNMREGLLGPEAMVDLGLAGFTTRTSLVRNLWPFVRSALSPEFAAYLGSEMDLPPE